MDLNKWQCDCSIETGGNAMALSCTGNKLSEPIGQMIESFHYFHASKSLQNYSLRYLEASDNRLARIPAEILLFEDVENLDFTSNSIHQVKFPILTVLNRLDVLILANNHIHSLIKGAFRFTAPLKLLNLRDNELSYIEPGSIQSVIDKNCINMHLNLIEFPISLQ